MKYSREEIIFFLSMHSIAKRKLTYLNLQQEKYRKEIIFYEFIWEHAERWISELELDEKEIIIKRFDEKKTFDQIAIEIGYANHSSTIRKYTQIIEKIRRTQ